MSLIPTAFAAGSAGGHASPLSSIWILAVFLVFIYFLMWRPQAKRVKKQRNMISSLKSGDEIVTSGGVLGRIADINETFITVLIAENVKIVLQKGSISSVLPKGTVKF